MQLIEERVALMPASSHHHRNVGLHPHGATAGGGGGEGGRAMDNQQALKCPRCDSTNTKFCYYNNYSLSQPRHFCKACKRYWTRGGTLRNVPVGGGCRKNKRIKKTTSTSTSAATAWAVADPPLYLTPQISSLSIPQSSTTVDQIFYGLHNTNSAVDLPSTSFLKSLEQRNLMSSLGSCAARYDFMNSHPSSLGLCFPMNTTTTTTTTTATTTTTTAAAHQGHNTVQFQAPDLASTSLMHEYSLLGSSLSSSSAASLLAASLRLPKMEATNPSGWPTTYDDVQAADGTLGFLKESKEEGESNSVVNHNSRLEWQIPCVDNQIDSIGAVNAGPSLYWSNSNAATSIGGGWPESVTNCGSSITPLI